MTANKSPFADFAKTLELQGRILKDVEQLAALSPSVARNWIAHLATLIDAPAAAPARANPQTALFNQEAPSDSGPSYFSRLVQVFVESGNQPLTKKQVAEALGIRVAAAHRFLYSKNNIPKLRREKSDSGFTLFSLHERVLAEAKKQGIKAA